MCVCTVYTWTNIVDRTLPIDMTTIWSFYSISSFCAPIGEFSCSLVLISLSTVTEWMHVFFGFSLIIGILSLNNVHLSHNAVKVSIFWKIYKLFLEKEIFCIFLLIFPSTYFKFIMINRKKILINDKIVRILKKFSVFLKLCIKINDPRPFYYTVTYSIVTRSMKLWKNVFVAEVCSGCNL